MTVLYLYEIALLSNSKPHGSVKTRAALFWKRYMKKMRNLLVISPPPLFLLPFWLPAG